MMDYRDVTVEKEDLNERESLELITRMIQNTKCRMAENAGMPFLLWGYMTVAVSLLVWFMLKQTGNADWNYLWFLLPLVAFPGTLWSGRKRKKMVRTYVDRIIGYVWTVFGLSAFLLSCVAVFGWDIPILFTILLLMGMGTALTGLIVGMKGRCIGSIVVVGLFLYTRYQSNAVFCVGLCFYDGDTGAYDEPGGLSKQERNCLCLRN